MTQVRLFAALELPGEVRSALAAWGASVAAREPALRLVPAEALHVTLVFLGAREEAEVEAIGAAVVAVARPVGPLTTAGGAWLPPRRPGVLVADVVEAGDGLALLQRDLVRALAPWHAPETRPFRPHVTVARVRRGVRVELREVPPPPRLTFAAPALVLYRSHPGRGGSRYEAVVRMVI